MRLITSGRQGIGYQDLLRSAETRDPAVPDGPGAAQFAFERPCRGAQYLCVVSSPLTPQSQVHLLPLGNIQLDRLQPYLARLHPHFDRVLGFRPTGWAYSPPAGTDMLPDVNMVIRRDQARTFSHASLKPMRGSCRQFMMYGKFRPGRIRGTLLTLGVPYSEHSSFFELTCFALSVPGPDVKMIATVNVGNEKRCVDAFLLRSDEADGLSRAKMKKW
jgi:DNA cross-link repair 1A protein